MSIELWVYLVLGFCLLLLAGDALVKGAVNLSLRMGIPALIVSLTIVAFGTSAPELFISISAVMDDKSGIALGNVVGSNTANILLVLGLPALAAGLATSKCRPRKTYLFMIAGTALFMVLAFRGKFDGLAGVALLLTLLCFLADAFFEAKKHRRSYAGMATENPEELGGVDPDMSRMKMYAFLIFGLAGLPVGSELLVGSASIIAAQFGVSDAVIGLTLVAIGTSLPELATTLMAAIRKQADVALGNVIGSNMFNVLGIIGIASIVGTIPVDAKFLRLDLWVMLGASLLIIPFVFRERDMSRGFGFAFTLLYVIYICLVLG
ncbi:MAG: calcium/sodium antiporter [Roseovarius sp.]|nr:calcium/sodium antiporter [Roseovarius sp.]